MEYLVTGLFLAVFFVVIFTREALAARKREKKYVQSLYESYGRVPQKEYKLERFARIDSYYQRHQEAFQIDDITWNDLNMDELFKRMNDTHCATGEEYLYYRLRTVMQTAEEQTHFEEMVSWFDANQEMAVRIKYLCHKLGYTGKYSLYDYLDNLDYLGERSSFRYFLKDLLFVPLFLLIPFQTAVALSGICFLAVYNIMAYFKEKEKVEPYIVSFAYITRLIDTCSELAKVEVPVCSEEWRCMRDAVHSLRPVRQGASLVLSMGQKATGSGNPLEILFDYLRMVFYVDLIQFNRMYRGVRTHLSDVDTLIGVIGSVETAMAVGNFRASLQNGWCLPEFSRDTNGTLLVMEEGYHPLLAQPVKNSICVSRGVLLTGSNASGKSTFLKTVAVNSILAQTIYTAAADRFSTGFWRIYTSMSLKDDIQSGESYYMVEIRALKRILDAASKPGDPVLCFVDEVLRGTNTVERIAATTQILKSLSGTNILAFAATHDIELTELLSEVFDNYHFEEDIRDGDIFFNYKLLNGKATTRNAIRLLEIMGYSPQVTEKAYNQAERFLQYGVWEP